jgi:hypothetical protein
MDDPKTSPVSHEHTHELLDEVLQHTSQQALRLSHLDEGMTELRAQMAALREEAQRKPGGPTSSAGFGGANDQVDAIERDARAARRKVSWLTALVAVQTLLLGALVFMTVRPKEAAPAQILQPVAEAAAAPRPVPVATEQAAANPFAGTPNSPDAAAAKPEPSAEATTSEVKNKKKRK